MDGDRVDAQVELGGYLLVGFAGDNVLEDFEFARGEACVTFALEISGEGNLRIENGFAFGNFLDGSDEVEIHRVFQDVAAGAGFERLADERVFGMHAEHEDGDVGKFGENAAGGFDAVDLRKGAIHNDDGGVELLGELNGLEAVAGLAYDVERGYHRRGAGKRLASRREFRRVRAWRRDRCRFGLPRGESLCRDLRLRESGRWIRIAGESRLLWRRNAARR